MEQIIIRPATDADIPAVHGLVYQLAVYENAPNAVVATPEEYLADFQRGIFSALVAEVDGTVAGMIIYYMSYSTWKGKMLYMEDFCVDEAYRRYGLGQKLYERYLEEARAAGCRMVKWQVLDWNEPALNFYRKNNAIIEEGWWNCKVFFEDTL